MRNSGTQKYTVAEQVGSEEGIKKKENVLITCNNDN